MRKKNCLYSQNASLISEGCCCFIAKSCLTLCDPMDYSQQAPLSMEFFRQEYWCGLPFPSPFLKVDILYLYDDSYLPPSLVISSMREGLLGHYSILSTLNRSCCRAVTESCPTLWPHGRQHARLPCPSPSPWVCSNSCPLSQWCYLTISSPAALFFFCLQSFPASRSFLMSWLFASGGQSIGASASASVLPMNIQDWFPLGIILAHGKYSVNIE